MINRDYQLSKAATGDIRQIVRYTRERYGEEQVQKYVHYLDKCSKELAKGEGLYKTLSAIHPDLRYCLCQHHYIFGVRRKSKPMLIVAVLHERMDLMTRLQNRL